MSLTLQEEFTLRIIIDNYDCSSGFFFVEKYKEYEGYNFNYLHPFFKELESDGLIYDVIHMPAVTRGRITQEGLLYFHEKELNRDMTLLKGEARGLLIELIESKDSNLAILLAAKFDGLDFNKGNRLRATIKYLVDNGYLNIPHNGWADNVPYFAALTYEGEHYLEFEDQEHQKEMAKQGKTYNIQTVNAQGGNLIIGDALNVSQTIHQSIANISKEIDERGEDQDALKEILAEVEQLAKEMEKSGKTPEKGKVKRFFEKASHHLSKHGWFYGAILQVLGQAALSQ